MKEKVFNSSELPFSEVTSYKIHTLIYKKLKIRINKKLIYVRIHIIPKMFHGVTGISYKLFQSKSFYRNRAGRHFYGTENEIWAGWLYYKKIGGPLHMSNF